MRVLFSDNLHLNNKNFGSLLNYLNQVGAIITYPKFNNDSICRFGDYAQWSSIVRIAEDMQDLDLNELAEIKYRGINLFDICHAELMSKCATKEHWISEQNYGNTKKELIYKLHKNDKEDLLLNLASARHWIEYWTGIVSAKTFDFIFIFSGSLTYASALIEVMKGFQGKVYLFESFFTGRHYYCEEKYSHLPNNTDAKFRSQLISRTAPGAVIDQVRLERGIKEALNVKNKNVCQPNPQRRTLFNNDKKTILIGGQVLNDFSLLKTTQTGIHSISLYKTVIGKLLSETELNIIFKAHPWENKKNNLYRAKTKEYLHDTFNDNSRIAIVEDYSISDLFAEVDYVAVINSQLGIEAALQGFKPIQIGKAFYGGYNFTYDIDNVDALINIIQSNSSGRLSIDEYSSLREYLMHMLVDYLVPEDISMGTNKLKQIFNIAPVKKTLPAPKVADKTTSIVKKEISVTISNEPQGNKKLKKLKSNPKKFFADSRFLLFRAIGKAL